MGPRADREPCRSRISATRPSSRVIACAIPVESRGRRGGIRMTSRDRTSDRSFGEHGRPSHWMGPYRDEVDALRERREALAKELETLREQAEALAAVRARAAEVAGEIAEVDERLRGIRRLPMLDGISVASPCDASWEAMKGDERVRFCGACEK